MIDVGDLPGESGGVRKAARRALGAQAFGFNYFTLPPGQEGREHSHEENNQEEVYFVVRGGGRMLIDGEEVELQPGRLVRVDAQSTRMPISGESGIELLTFGAPIDEPYSPPSWG